MPDLREFVVEIEVVRTVTTVISATDALSAREKANNLEFSQSIEGEITFWTVKRVDERTADK
mgnify:CR=1 FL=1